MNLLQAGDKIRHPSRGVGVVEKVRRNAFGSITKADVRFNGVLVPNLWVDDLAIFETAQPPQFTPQIVPPVGPRAA